MAIYRYYFVGSDGQHCGGRSFDAANDTLALEQAAAATAEERARLTFDLWCGVRRVEGEAPPVAAIEAPVRTAMARGTYWRNRAEEARTIADCTDDPVAKASMITVAASYHLLADRADSLEALNALKPSA